MKEVLPNIYQVTITLKVGPVKVPSAMFVIKAGEEVILIDPFELHGSEIREIEALGKPMTVLITGETHVRGAEVYRKRYGAKILANREAVPTLGLSVDDAFSDGEALPGQMTAIGMPGTQTGGTIFRREQGEGVLIVGDALMNLQPGERGLLLRLIGFPKNLGKMPTRFMEDKNVAAESYQKLLDYAFDQILVSHSSPILSGAKERLRIALEKR